jgi:hypothetical protein
MSNKSRVTHTWHTRLALPTRSTQHPTFIGIVDADGYSVKSRAISCEIQLVSGPLPMASRLQTQRSKDAPMDFQFTSRPSSHIKPVWAISSESQNTPRKSVFIFHGLVHFPEFT